MVFHADGITLAVGSAKLHQGANAIICFGAFARFGDLRVRFCLLLSNEVQALRTLAASCS